jgi:hypothetical protein
MRCAPQLGQVGRSAWPMDPIPLPKSELRQYKIADLASFSTGEASPVELTESDR